MTQDPFRHLPGLRDKITPFERSSFRDFSAEKVAAILDAEGMPPFPAYDDEDREALRAEALEDHEGDLWIFAYGSLIWDPALDFSEVRMAFAPEHSRRFILVDRYGGRGTEEAPGLMAALDDGDGCDGLAFRIKADKVDAETEILFRREMICPGYHARHILVEIDGEEATALTFIADHDSELIDGEISRASQIECVAHGTGFLGTSLQYLESTVSHLAEFGIVDDDAEQLLEATRAYVATLG
jgi:cation transport protein ChaC